MSKIKTVKRKKVKKPTKVSDIPTRNHFLVAALKLKPGAHRDRRERRERKYRHRRTDDDS